MSRNDLIKLLLSLCFFGFATGCASTQTVDGVMAEDELRDVSLDVLFATEFPVDSIEEAYANAAMAMRDGNVDKAIFFYIKALQFEPENAELLATIAGIHMQRGSYRYAKRALLRACTIDPEFGQAQEMLGLIYFVENRREEATDALTRAVSLGDTFWRAHNALGIYADQNNDYATAQAHYDAALEINPRAPQVLNNRGYSKYLSGDLKGAAIDFYEAAKEHGFSHAWLNLGMVYARQGWYDDALETYQEVISDAHAFNNAGEIAMDNGDYDKAQLLLAEAVRRSPTYFPEAEQNLKRLNQKR